MFPLLFMTLKVTLKFCVVSAYSHSELKMTRNLRRRQENRRRTLHGRFCCVTHPVRYNTAAHISGLCVHIICRWSTSHFVVIKLRTTYMDKVQRTTFCKALTLPSVILFKLLQKLLMPKNTNASSSLLRLLALSIFLCSVLKFAYPILYFV